MSTDTDVPGITEDEKARAAAMLAELHAYGYQDVAEHGDLRPGVRIRHRGHQYPEAYDNGTGVVVAITHKPDSAWSQSYRTADVEMVVLWDRPGLCDSRLSQVAQYHVVVHR
jgi:hypothetical protein